MDNDTESLRNAAPKWTLAGDKQLLDILQNIHQSLMTRCQEVNRRLDEMVTALDDASVDLQNVNNKFMALSNNQFIESRVYDDDVEVTKQETTKDTPSLPTNNSELDNIRAATEVFQRWHEPLRICGDDSDTDSDSEITSMVLKPKDMYTHRPLPLIIGTPAWRSKWHAGLLVEDSDTDSSTSKPEAPDDEYSESELDEPVTRDRNELTVPDTQESTTSSELLSEQDLQPVRPSPSAVAAELARRLQGNVPIPQEEDSFVAPPTTKKIYRPEQPTTGTIFSDEPPPFDGYQSEESVEDDIFAELHKKPNVDSSKVQSRVVEDLFGGIAKRDVFDEFGDNKAPPPIASEKSTLFEDESEPELFASKPTNQREETAAVETVKKPIGGISLFGSNAGAESIGAAILKRNRRKSSSEEETTSENSIHREDKRKTTDNDKAKVTEKDIFDDLFAKSEREQKKKEIVNKEVKSTKEVKPNKVDLFSDNLFDDIDDIFTNDIKVTKSNDKQKSLFDENDDDLFSDIAVAKEKPQIRIESKNKSIFDSDDDLFGENIVPVTKPTDVKESNIKTSNKSSEGNKNSLFNDDDDIYIFTNSIETKEDAVINTKIVESSLQPKSVHTQNEGHNLETNNVKNNNLNNNTNISIEKPPPLFDDDDSDDVFNKTNKLSINIDKSKNTKPKENTNAEVKTSLFDDEESDDLFTGPSKSSNKDTNDYNVFHATIKDLDNKEKANVSNNNNTEKYDIYNTTEQEMKASIFDDDDVDNIFSSSNLKSTKVIDSSIPEKSTDNLPVPISTNSKSDQAEITFSTKVEQKVVINKDGKSVSETVTTVDEKSVKQSIESDFLEAIIDTSNKTKPEESDSLFDKVKDSVFNKSDDIFNDIIDEPPAFEKPKEPKKSKNVNALFDDDSDDEALFFKKNDVIFDDKPDADVDNQNDPIFGLFHDEPPAIDVDFTTKSNKINTEIDDDDNLFKTIENDEHKKGSKNKDVIDINADEDLFKTNTCVVLSNTKEAQPSISKVSNKIIDDINRDSDSDIFQTPEANKEPIIATKQKDIQLSKPTETIKNEIQRLEKANSTNLVKPTSPKSESQDTPDSPESKKIGKLKTMNFNIDVSTLLPGASPKKKPIEQTDGQVFSGKSQEDLHAKDNIQQPLVKSVSFEGEPDSQILDNKISKERAKIQVKRRPSTRRARKEAVRKSVLDIGEDSTDNSSSIDDTPKEQIIISNEVKQGNENNDQNVENEIEQIITNIYDNSKDFALNKDTDSRILDNERNSSKTEQKSLTNEITRGEESSNTGKVITESKNVNVETKITNSDITVVKQNVKSKVVYILNDEDIFDSPVIENPVENPKIDNEFKHLKETNISTIGNVYKETNKPKKSLFDDLSDEENELFNTNKKANTKTKTILDSDSEDDLFGGKKEKDVSSSRVKETCVKMKVDVKASLFGDDEDDDDLFGAKAKTEQAPTQPVKSTRDVVMKPTEPVLHDPLSLLQDNDD